MNVVAHWVGKIYMYVVMLNTQRQLALKCSIVQAILRIVLTVPVAFLIYYWNFAFHVSCISNHMLKQIIYSSTPFQIFLTYGHGKNGPTQIWSGGPNLAAIFGLGPNLAAIFGPTGQYIAASFGPRV